MRLRAVFCLTVEAGAKAEAEVHAMAAMMAHADLTIPHPTQELLGTPGGRRGGGEDRDAAPDDGAVDDDANDGRRVRPRLREGSR